MSSYVSDAGDDPFRDSRIRFTAVVDFLGGGQAAGMTHGELEERLNTEGMALLRQLLQDSLDLRAVREPRLYEVFDADAVARGTASPGRERTLTTIFGPVAVARIAYRATGCSDLHPADAVLNLPAETHSHGLRRLAAVEAARGSFEAAAAAILRATGVKVGKRQVEQMATRAAADIDGFYTTHLPQPAPDGDVLVLSFDGKGVVMRPDGLRPATAKTAAQTNRKLSARLSKGEKRGRKRMAEVAAVYDLTPLPRTPADVWPDDTQRDPPAPTPRATGKWLTASVTDDTAVVIAAGFGEADRRDPDRRRTWAALVDGNSHQIERIGAEAKARKVNVTIVIDFVKAPG